MHFNITKPQSNDYFSLGVMNDNYDEIDDVMYANQQSAAKVMVGATSLADGESGRVPAPTSADRTKYLKGDGTWGTPSGGGGGASAVADLTDVNLTSLSDGQILKYDATNQEWINANESGGGEGRSYTEDILWSGSITASTNQGTLITLNKNVSDYDMIVFHTGNNSFTGDNPFLVSNIVIGERYISTTYGGENLGAYFDYTSDTSLTIYSAANATPTTYTKITGVKFGTGGGGSGGILKGLDYANAVTLTLPDYTGYDYTPIGYGVLMATSYGGAGSIVITSQNEDVKYLSFRNDTWTTSWIPVTKDETYHLNRGSSSTDFPSGSWFKFIPWLCEDGGGSSQITYSTTEHKIGTWIDGSDVYEKTISISNVSLSSGSYETVDTITGLDTIISCNGYVVEGNLKYTLNDISLRVIQDGTSVKLYSPSGTTWTIPSGAIIIRHTKASS